MKKQFANDTLAKKNCDICSTNPIYEKLNEKHFRFLSKRNPILCKDQQASVRKRKKR